MPPARRMRQTFPLGYYHYLSSFCGEKKASALIAFRKTGIEAYLQGRILVSKKFIPTPQEEEALSFLSISYQHTSPQSTLGFLDCLSLVSKPQSVFRGTAISNLLNLSKY